MNLEEKKDKSVDYIRCTNCSYVYEATLNKCPQCNKDTVISEDLIEEPVFNICD